MAARALVAYERDSADGPRYDLHYAHWGAADLRLRHELGPETPFGGGAVDPDPLAIGLPFPEATARVDPGVHEAFYAVSAGFEVTAYLVVPFARPGGAGEGGALVGAGGDPPEAAADLRTWFEGVRQAAWDVHDWGLLDRRAVRAYLADALRRWTDREVVALDRNSGAGRPDGE